MLIDKPLGWTSFDVVNKIRHRVKCKVGHGGTLDPRATGLLIIATGRKTKTLSGYLDMDKIYEGSMIVGATTASYDSETPPENQKNYEHLTEEAILEATSGFIGDIKQLTPPYSAVKIKGKPLYEYARKGKQVTLPPRLVTVYQFEITHIQLPEIHFMVKCSKGTYIRTLIHDFGQELSCGAYLTSLKRTSIGPYNLSEAWALTDFVDLIESIQ